MALIHHVFVRRRVPEFPGQTSKLYVKLVDKYGVPSDKLCLHRGGENLASFVFQFGSNEAGSRFFVGFEYEGINHCFGVQMQSGAPNFMFGRIANDSVLLDMHNDEARIAALARSGLLDLPGGPIIHTHMPGEFWVRNSRINVQMHVHQNEIFIYI